jgi:hypothetical protein
MVRGIYTHHPKPSRWLLSPGISEKSPDAPESPKLAIRFKSSGYSRHFSGIFGKSRISGKFPEYPKLHWTAQVTSEKKP